ncbi:1,2-phenylacetyl-CoA epoxidase subunit PaaE [Chelatococcus reniformis]|uniref:Phenylacetic acid degradation protein n=1 Tax=Chelatococcus reniformis TaxID=1494448 RepID=A0A916U2R3_9HYPH|nr:1,2-phenylacetyl-CoA epoxidase subunit PaaE [Chelatococcus reniformis]GGC54810.1 phenylacetic acid degradation protein [Chelatococcus reniformis]
MTPQFVTAAPDQPPPPPHLPASAAPRFHRLLVADVRRETADAVSIAFDVPPPLADAFRFVPGQYLTLRTTLDGEEVRRSYSICSGPGDGELRIAVKRVDSGLFSAWANGELTTGDAIEVMSPAGRFGLAALPGDGRIHIAFAAGSGITPVLSILRGVLACEPTSRFFLFYGNRSTADVLFRRELEELKDRFLGRLSVFHVLSQEEQDLPILSGRLDADKARRLLTALVPAAAVDHAFLCGPETMIDDLTTALTDLGMSPEAIHVERFVSAYGGQARAHAPLRPDAPAKWHADLIIDGKRRSVPVADGETILDAALRAGLDMPFACKGGMCSTCRARLAEGEIEMDVNYSLEPWELAANFVLTCQSRPRSARVLVDFDQM